MRILIRFSFKQAEMNRDLEGFGDDIAAFKSWRHWWKYRSSLYVDIILLNVLLAYSILPFSEQTSFIEF